MGGREYIFFAIISRFKEKIAVGQNSADTIEVETRLFSRKLHKNWNARVHNHAPKRNIHFHYHVVAR